MKDIMGLSWTEAHRVYCALGPAIAALEEDPELPIVKVEIDALNALSKRIEGVLLAETMRRAAAGEPHFTDEETEAMGGPDRNAQAAMLVAIARGSAN